MKSRVSESRGWTLVELLLSTSLFLLILTWIFPGMTGYHRTIRVKAGAQALYDTLELARGEAVKSNGRIVICKSSKGVVCEADARWEHGWIVFNDVDNNGILNGTEKVLHREHAQPSSLSIRGNRPISEYVSYNAYGQSMLTSGAFQTGTFTVCDRQGNPVSAHQVIINGAGRVRMSKTSNKTC